MTFDELVIVTVNGISFGFLLFLVAVGLSLVFGVMGILNLAHGAFFMLGAYLAYEFGGAAALSLPLFILVMIGSGLVTAAIAAVLEAALFRRIYYREHLEILVFAFALIFVAEGAVRLQWGPNPLIMSYPEGFASSVSIFGAPVPEWSLLIIVAGLVILAGLAFLLFRTRIGYVIRAVAEDSHMAGALGLNVGLVFTGVFALGALLAAIGGSLVAPTLALTPQLGLLFLVQAFAVVVVGGLDSIPGSLVAAIILGLANSFLVFTFSGWAPYSFYLGLIVVLLLRPQGILGSRELTKQVG
ncbi:MAG: branched-chain amino acid ABC transporter permease [Pseudonocardiaceae bacterium]|nr:branched-chain amino acid ABC transporter permease [Pseudonocardiaceae bacterium]